MIFVSGLLVLFSLIWLSRPPRDNDRRALLAGTLLTAVWFVYAGFVYGVPLDITAPQFRWLLLFALIGAPLVMLLVWSGVTLLTRPRVTSDDSGQER